MVYHEAAAERQEIESRAVCGSMREKCDADAARVGRCRAAVVACQGSPGNEARSTIEKFQPQRYK